MQNHFIKMFNYDRYANLLLLENMITGAPEKPVQLMAHLLATQQVWLCRCKGLPVAAGMAWPDWKAETFESLIQQNYADWIAFIRQSDPADFSKIIPYQNSKGEHFQNQLSDIIAHVINHGTHHRAQIGQLLKQNRLEPLPVTDYIIYLRDNGL